MALLTKLDSLDAVQRHHAGSGGHFFDRDTMRFFRSKLGPFIGCTEDERTAVFLTSERFEDTRGNRHPRQYTIRVYTITDDGGNGWRIEEPWGFQAFNSLSTAKGKARIVLATLRANKPANVAEYVRATFRKEASAEV